MTGVQTCALPISEGACSSVSCLCYVATCSCIPQKEERGTRRKGSHAKDYEERGSWVKPIRPSWTESGPKPVEMNNGS